MNRIIVNFIRCKNLVIADVAHTPKGLIGCGRIKEGAFENKRFSIKSASSPELRDNVLYLHGSECSSACKVVLYRYDTPNKAADAVCAFTKLINEYNAIHFKTHVFEACENAEESEAVSWRELL